MEICIISLFLMSTLSYAMEPDEHEPLLHNDKIIIPMNHAQEAKFPSLKTLAAKKIAQHYQEFDQESLKKLPQDYKDLVELELPLTNDNAWKIFTENKDRQKECLEFLQKKHNLKSKIIFSPDKLFHSSYNAEHDIILFLEKIKNDLTQEKTFAPETKINDLAIYSANQVEKDSKKLHKITGCCNCVIVAPCVICYITCFSITFLVLVTVGTPAFPF